jgi:hypothetical protein
MHVHACCQPFSSVLLHVLSSHETLFFLKEPSGVCSSGNEKSGICSLFFRDVYRIKLMLSIAATCASRKLRPCQLSVNAHSSGYCVCFLVIYKCLMCRVCL